MPDMDIEGTCFAANILDNSTVQLYITSEEAGWKPFTVLPLSWLRDLSQIISNTAIKVESMVEALGNG